MVRWWLDGYRAMSNAPVESSRICDACYKYPRLQRLTPAALEQRVVEHRRVIVLPRDDDGFVPDARVIDSIVVHLSPEPPLVDLRERVPGSVHAPAAVAAADHRDELV